MAKKRKTRKVAIARTKSQAVAKRHKRGHRESKHIENNCLDSGCFGLFHAIGWPL